MWISDLNFSAQSAAQPNSNHTHLQHMSLFLMLVIFYPVMHSQNFKLFGM